MTEHRLSFKVPGDPVPTPRPRNPPLSMMIKSKKVWLYSGNKESKAWAKAIQAACPETYHFDEAEVKVYFLTNKSYDVDNLAKGLLDALTGYLWDNDKVVWHLDLCRLECGKTEPSTTIEVVGDEPEHTQARLLSEVV